MGETGSLELTNQGFSPLVLGVLLILHLIAVSATGQVLNQKSVAPFFSSWGMAASRDGVFGVEGKNWELRKAELEKTNTFPLHPCFQPPSRPCHPRLPHPPTRPSFPAQPPSVPGSHPGPSSAPAGGREARGRGSWGRGRPAGQEVGRAGVPHPQPQAWAPRDGGGAGAGLALPFLFACFEPQRLQTPAHQKAWVGGRPLEGRGTKREAY